METARAKLAATLCGVVAFVTAGCTYSSAPQENVGFAHVTDLHALDGRYRNRGEGGPEEAPLFLSALVFPADTSLDHAAIEVLDVRATSAGALTVRAISTRGVVVKESTFISGRDFTLDEGRLRIRNRRSLLGHAPDDPLVGPRNETVELGIDLRGQGKYRSAFTGAGLVYLLVPVAIHASTEIRFERLED